MPAGDDAELAHAHAEQSLHDVFEDGLALDLKHGFRDLSGEIFHASAFTGGEDDGFHLRDARYWILDVSVIQPFQGSDYLRRVTQGRLELHCVAF